VLSLTLIAAIASAAIWLYLLAARGNFWHLRPFDDDLANHTPPRAWPKVTAIIPARNEAETIAQAIASVLQQNYTGEFSIILVDDHSEDTTAELARKAAEQRNNTDRLKILASSPLPPNWTGKLWALNEGVNATSSSPSTYLWFSDADITHAPDTLTRLVSRAEKENLDLTSLMVQLQAKSFAERATIPAFLFFFLKLYPPKWTANTKSHTAGAAGGCILLRTQTLQRIGGLESIRQEVIDDCALARAIKRSGAKIWTGLTRQSVSLRPYNTFAEICDMIARTAFTQLRYSTLLLLGTLLGLAITYLAPIALLFAHNNVTRAVALATWLAISLLFLPTIRYYRLSPLWSLLLPATAAFYAYATLLSAIRQYANRGAQWKGRSQAPVAPLKPPNLL
jgi:hopene-associated glycosyltransferase HpnB